MLSEILDKAAESKRYARIKANAHYLVAHNAQKNNRNFGIVVTCLSSVVGTTIFATISKDQLPGNYSYLKVLTGLLSVAAAVFSALQTFLGFSENAEKNRKAALAFEAVCYKIDQFVFLYTPLSDSDDSGIRTNALGGLNEISLALLKASENAPTIPNWLYNRFKRANQP